MPHRSDISHKILLRVQDISNCLPRGSNVRGWPVGLSQLERSSLTSLAGHGGPDFTAHVLSMQELAFQGPSCAQLVPENIFTTVSLHSMHELVSKILTEGSWLMQDASNHLSRGSTVQGRLARNSQLGRAQLDDYASRVMALDEEGESFVQKIHRLFTEAGTLHVHCFCMAILWHDDFCHCTYVALPVMA